MAQPEQKSPWPFNTEMSFNQQPRYNAPNKYFHCNDVCCQPIRFPVHRKPYYDYYKHAGSSEYLHHQEAVSKYLHLNPYGPEPNNPQPFPPSNLMQKPPIQNKYQPNEFFGFGHYRFHPYDTGTQVNITPMKNLLNNKKERKPKKKVKELDVRQFLSTWQEKDDEGPDNFESCIGQQPRPPFQNYNEPVNVEKYNFDTKQGNQTVLTNPEIINHKPPFPKTYIEHNLRPDVLQSCSGFDRDPYQYPYRPMGPLDTVDVRENVNPITKSLCSSNKMYDNGSCLDNNENVSNRIEKKWDNLIERRIDKIHNPTVATKNAAAYNLISDFSNINYHEYKQINGKFHQATYFNGENALENINLRKEQQKILFNQNQHTYDKDHGTPSINNSENIGNKHFFPKAYSDNHPLQLLESVFLNSEEPEVSSWNGLSMNLKNTKKNIIDPSVPNISKQTNSSSLECPIGSKLNGTINVNLQDRINFLKNKSLITSTGNCTQDKNNKFDLNLASDFCSMKKVSLINFESNIECGNCFQKSGINQFRTSEESLLMQNERNGIEPSSFNNKCSSDSSRIYDATNLKPTSNTFDNEINDVLSHGVGTENTSPHRIINCSRNYDIFSRPKELQSTKILSEDEFTNLENSHTKENIQILSEPNQNTSNIKETVRKYELENNNNLVSNIFLEANYALANSKLNQGQTKNTNCCDEQTQDLLIKTGSTNSDSLNVPCKDSDKAICNLNSDFKESFINDNSKQNLDFLRSCQETENKMDNQSKKLEVSDKSHNEHKKHKFDVTYIKNHEEKGNNTIQLNKMRSGCSQIHALSKYLHCRKWDSSFGRKTWHKAMKKHKDNTNVIKLQNKVAHKILLKYISYATKKNKQVKNQTNNIRKNKKATKSSKCPKCMPCEIQNHDSISKKNKKTNINRYKDFKCLDLIQKKKISARKILLKYIKFNINKKRKTLQNSAIPNSTFFLGRCIKGFPQTTESNRSALDSTSKVIEYDEINEDINDNIIPDVNNWPYLEEEVKSISETNNLKCSLRWDQIFNTKEKKGKNETEEKAKLNLGPAKIELRFGPGKGPGQWQIITHRRDTNARVLKVKSLIMQPKSPNEERVPTVVIKKTEGKEYTSFLKNKLQPTVRIERSNEIDKMARGNITTDGNQCDICSMLFESREEHLKHKCTSKEAHHCILCQQSFSTVDSFILHQETRAHRHLEIVQKNAIHGMYKLLTGEECPFYDPLTLSERDHLNWQPNYPGYDHHYYHTLPM